MNLGLVTVYILNQAFHWFIVGLFFPIMVLFLIDKGLDSLEVGTSIAAYSAALILLELPTGGLSDSIGRKRVYLISLTVQMGSLAWLLMSWNYPGLLLGLFGMGTARALSSGTIDAWFVDEFKRENPKGDLQKSLAKANVFIPAGIAVGSLLGGLIPMTLGDYLNSHYGVGIYSSNIIVILLALVAQFIVTQRIVVEVAGRSRRESIVSGLKRFPEVVSTSVQYGLRNKIVLALMLASLALGFGIMSVEVFWQPRLKDLLGTESSTWIFGVMAAGYFLAASVGNILITPLCSRIGPKYPQILFGLRVAIGGCLLLLALQNSVAGFAIFFMTFLLINGMSNSPHATIFNSQVPGERRSTLMSFESFIFQGGGLFGSITFGFIAQSASIGAAWVVAAFVLIASSVTYMALSLKRTREKIRADVCSVASLDVGRESLG